MKSGWGITCPSMDKWKNKMQYIRAMEYYSALKREELLTCTMIWMNLENITLSEIGQTQKDKYCLIPLRGVSGNSQETESRIGGGCGLAQRGNGVFLFNGYRISIWEKFWRWWWWLHSNVNALNAAELYTQ